MSYTSNYNLNIRLSNLEARINALVPVPPGYAYDLVSVLGVGNSAGTFDIDMNNNDILNCNDLDVVTINGGAYPPVSSIPTITQVLTANNNALDKSQIFSATGSPTTTNIDDAEIQIIDGTSGINSKLEYDNLTLIGNYVPYNNTNIVSNTGMVVTAIDNSNPYFYSSTANYATFNQTKQNISTFLSETATMSFDGIYHETNDTSGSGDLTKLSMKSSAFDGTIRCFNSGLPSALAPIDFQASALTLNGNPITSPTPDLTAVLTAGANAGNLSITNLNNIDVITINTASYPPATPSWNDTLNVSATANQSIYLNNFDVNSVNNIQLNTINGLAPTTIGLNWSDFTGANAYNQLPNNAYEVANGAEYTRQHYNLLQVYNGNATNNYANYTSSGIDLIDINSSTTTSYNSNNITVGNGTDFTITQNAGQNINLNCGQLVINGTPYPPAPTPPPQRWGYYQNTGQAFSASSGGFTNVGLGSSPIQTLSGMTPLGSYTIAIQFNCWVDTPDTTSSCYLGYSNSAGSFNANCLYDSGTPCPNTTSVGIFPSGSATQFTIQDTLIFVAGNSGELYLDLFFGTNAGWGGYYKWSLSAQIVSP